VTYATDFLREAARLFADSKAEITRIDSVASFWDGPRGCRTLSPDSLAALWRVRTERERTQLRAAVVQGLSELRWTQPAKEVIATVGVPDQQTHDSIAGTTSMIWMNRRILNHEASLFAVVDDRVGLVETSYMFSGQSGTACTSLFEELVSTVRLRFSTVAEPKERVSNETASAMSLCDAVRIERGTAAVRWQDSISTVSALVSIGSTGTIIVMYSTGVGTEAREFRKWLDKRKAF
jgi:hypothetical protein